MVKELAGEQFQTEMAKAMSYVPNRTSLASVLSGDEGTAAMAAGAAVGRATPNTPNWAAVEANNSVIKQYMTAVLTGADPAAEAKKPSPSPSPRPSTARLLRGVAPCPPTPGYPAAPRTRRRPRRPGLRTFGRPASGRTC